MRKIIGVLLIVTGIAVGIYIGLYVCLVGGIIQLWNVFHSEVVNPTDLAWGLVRILGASFCGAITGGLIGTLGGYLLTSTRKYR